MPEIRTQVHTHRGLDPDLCGRPVRTAPGEAEVVLTATRAMAADDEGLVHGGFVFGLADHAAMLAVNEPTVVLARAEARFLAPVAVGERMTARARVVPTDRQDRPVVEAEVAVEERPVFAGTFRCAVPERHVLAGPGGPPGRPGGREEAPA